MSCEILDLGSQITRDVYNKYNLRCFSVLYPLEDREVYDQEVRITSGRGEVVVARDRGGLIYVIPRPTPPQGFFLFCLLVCFQGKYNSPKYLDLVTAGPVPSLATNKC